MLQANVISLPQNVNRHKHTHYQLVLGLTGTAEIDMCGLAARLDVSHACIVPTETFHDFYGRPRNHVLVIDLDQDYPAFLDSHHPDYDLLNPMFERPQLVTLDRGLQQLTQVSIQEIQWAQDDRALRHHLACSIIRCLSRRISPSVKRQKSPVLDMHRIDQFIYKHLHERICISDLAGSICVSERHFHELFKQATNQTPHQYVIRARLDYAKRLMLETNLSIAEISQKCGFSSQSALTNCMRKHDGLTPKQVQKRSQQSNRM
ncbi:AraC family transcriptional regulator [Hahella aquimaris]|uniref:AraC family transcriptional regulator n=1 Tax=Hahella sp. HNIBRBA332 TaxID=3015983 RepID=UPI00273BB86F|nr:AraC family transcriptional regulator [Hahella sp. HNIBRBA332]WLQ11490.1 AraC family transcriptional regulator [Hahella sp. HNIBRBA332]